MRIHLDLSFDPYYHIALEHFYLYDDIDIEKSPVLLIYRNQESVVFGNFQNPWLECNVNYCVENNIKLVRRFSGGGCVFHDLGNINFCYIGPKESNSKSILSDYLINFLQSENILASIGDKSDLLLDKKKISGSAFRETKSRTLHHCTLLFNSNLEKLNRSLSSPLKKEMINTKALPSRPAVVRDLSQFHWSSASDIINSFVMYMKNQLSSHDLVTRTLELTENRWNTFDFIWGKTPNFELQMDEMLIKVQGGLMVEVKLLDGSIYNMKVLLPAKPERILSCFEINKYQMDYLKKIGFIKG